MNELPLNIQKDIRRYHPVKTDGLTLYPVLVREYTEFAIARPALEVMQQSFPVALMRVPLLAALYQMDIEAAAAGEIPAGLFARALLVLALSLRLGEGQDINARMQQFRMAFDPKNPATLLCLRFMDNDGEEKEITPTLFQKLRPIIAAQNGVKIEDDDANPDIVKARKDMAAAAGGNIDANVDDLISAVSALSHADESEIDEWPILKLEKTARAYERVLGYIVCGISEGSGASWKTGNPTPHPFFARSDDGTGLFAPLGETDNGGKVEAPDRIRQLATQTIQFP